HVDVTVAYPLLAVPGRLTLPRGEVPHVHRRHPNPGHRVQHRPRERATGRKPGQVRGVTDKHPARLHPHPRSAPEPNPYATLLYRYTDRRPSSLVPDSAR